MFSRFNVLHGKPKATQLKSIVDVSSQLIASASSAMNKDQIGIEVVGLKHLLDSTNVGDGFALGQQLHSSLEHTFIILHVAASFNDSSRTSLGG